MHLRSDSVLSLNADLRNVSHARQRLIVSNWPLDDLKFDNVRGNIRGVAVTPAGRLLVAHSVSSIAPNRALRLLRGIEAVLVFDAQRGTLFVVLFAM